MQLLGFFFGLCSLFGRLIRAGLQDLKGRFAIKDLVIFAGHIRRGQDGLAFSGRDRPQLARWRADQRAFDNPRHTLFLQHRRDRLTYAHLLDRVFGRKARVLAISLRRHPQLFTVLRGKGAQGVLDAVAELAKDILGNVRRVLGDEVNPYTLRPDEARDLLDLVDQRLWGILEQQVCLVKEENQLGLVGVADLRQFLEKLAQQPQQEGGVKARRSHQLIRGEDVNRPLALGVRAHQIRQFQRRLTEKLGAALVLKNKQTPLDRANRLGRYVAVSKGQILAVLTDPYQQRLQVF